MLPPEGRGGWEPIFYGIYQMQQRNRKRRRELEYQLIKRFRSGAESLPDAVVMMTTEGTIFWCNRHAQALLGFRWYQKIMVNIFLICCVTLILAVIFPLKITSKR